MLNCSTVCAKEHCCKSSSSSTWNAT